MFLTNLFLYHCLIIKTFNDHLLETFWKHCRKRRKCWLPAFSPFPTMFSILSKTWIIILATMNLSSANAFNLVKAKILSFGKWVKLLFPRPLFYQPFLRTFFITQYRILMIPREKAFENVFLEKKKMLVTSIFYLFSTLLFTLSKAVSIILCHFLFFVPQVLSIWQLLVPFSSVKG